MATQPRTGPPSLQELAAKETTKQVLRMDNDSAQKFFATLNPRLQQLLFGSLTAKNFEVQESYNKLQEYVKRCPSIDRYLKFRKRAPRPRDVEASKSPSSLRDWSYVTPGSGDEYVWSRCDTESGKIFTSWSTKNLLSSARHHDLFFVPHSVPHPDRASGSITRAEILMFPSPSRRFSEHISSQLLFYNLCGAFGMPPPAQRTYSKWQAILIHKDRKAILKLEDDKGSAYAYYAGARELSWEAFRILGFIAGKAVCCTIAEKSWGYVVEGCKPKRNEEKLEGSD